MSIITHQEENPLGTQPIERLLPSLALPAMTANIVNALYNIVDQIFIGQGVGKLGNAATSIAFPLTTICMAIGLMVGLGAASGYNLELGKQHQAKAGRIAGSAASFLLLCGLVMMLLVRIFLEPMLKIFGATDAILPYAIDYAGITSLGLPFFLFSTGFNPLVRADRSPRYSMMAIMAGALLNTALDPLFMFVFGWGIAGAAWATVLSQIISAAILLAYIPRFQSVRLAWSDFRPRLEEIGLICRLGFNSFIYQFSNLLVQVTLNNLLRVYGSQSIYGADTPIAVAGIVTKVNVIFVALILGLISGAQPIFSYNYGAGHYQRVRQAMRLTLISAVVISVTMWITFEWFPEPIIALFGSEGGDQLYREFALKFMRIFLFFVFLNGVQICATTFFAAVGKAGKSAFLSFSKQILFLIPLLLVLPHFLGLDGLLYAQPVTDLLSFMLAMFFLYGEFKKMPQDTLSSIPKGA